MSPQNAAPRPLYLANKPKVSKDSLDVFDKWSGKLAARVSLASDSDLEEATNAAQGAIKPMRDLPRYVRRDVLMHCVKRFQERSEELAEALVVEAGKPIKDSRGEVTRLIDTFRIAAEEATRSHGEVMSFDISERTQNYSGRFERFPIGAAAFITPFNFPLNLVAHKVAPAIAAGCPFVLKPASATPLGALIVGEVLAETNLPIGAFSVLPCSRELGTKMVEDPRFAVMSFTGSPDVGWDFKARAGRKRVVLELGGNAAVIVDRDADLDDAVERIIFGAFYQSGQSCISVQRILMHAEIAQTFRRKLVEKAKALKAGDPHLEETFVGPLIRESDAVRIQEWIDQAVREGAKVLCGGKREGALMAATLLEDVPRHLPLVAKEVFGPVAVLSTFDGFDQALSEVNESDFGIHAGVFTRDLYNAEKAFRELEVGGVIVGDVPSFRVDNMPYGGVKGSGTGREGVRFAIEDMTEIKSFVLRTKN